MVLLKKNLFVIFALIFFVSFSFAAVPIISSSTNPEGGWSSEQFIKAKFAYSGAEKFVYVVDQNPDTVPALEADNSTIVDASSGEIVLGSKLDGVYYIHARAKSGSSWSDAGHYEIKVDRNGPTRPDAVEAFEQPDGTILIKWSASGDDLAGIAYYNVFRSNLRFVKEGNFSREFRITDAVAKKVGPEVTETSFLDTEIAEGYRYHYKIQPIDNAGNWGSVSAAASARAPSFCDFEPKFSFEMSGERLDITVSADVEFKKGHVVITGPDNKEIVLVESESNVKVIDTNYSLTGKVNGDYNVAFSSIDDDQDECYADEVYVFDTVAPETEILSPETTQVLSDLVQFVFKVDNKGDNPSPISSVELFVKKGVELVSVGEASPEGDNFVYDWNTLNFDNGRFEVLVRATDSVGNLSEASGLYNIQNTAFQRADAEQAIASAENALDIAKEYFISLSAQNIEVADDNSLFGAGLQELDGAKDLFEQGFYFELAKEKADFASKRFSDVKKTVVVSNYNSAVYIYDLSQTDLFLQATGLDASITSNAKTMIERLQPSRKLELKKIISSGQTFYQANMVLSFANSSSEASEFKAVEIIPKKFSDDVNRIFSNSNFIVLQSDPVILFDGLNVPANGSAEVVYSLKGGLSKEQADALIASNLMGYYISPPLPLDQSIDISSVQLSSLLNLSSFVSSLPPIEWNTTNLMILAFGAFILLFLLFLIFVLVVFAIYFFFIRKKKVPSRWN